MPPLELVLPVLGYVVAPALLVAAIVFGLSLWLCNSRATGAGAVAAFSAGCLVANFFREPLLPWLPAQLGWQCLLWVGTVGDATCQRHRATSTAKVAFPLATRLRDDWRLRVITHRHAATLVADGFLPAAEEPADSAGSAAYPQIPSVAAGCRRRGRWAITGIMHCNKCRRAPLSPPREMGVASTKSCQRDVPKSCILAVAPMPTDCASVERQHAPSI